MRRLTLVSALLGFAFGGVAVADDGLEAPDSAPVVTTTTTQTDTAPVTATSKHYGPGSIEAGLYLGGFITNFYHQFYDKALEASRPELDKVAPEFGLRFAFFPHQMFGIEVDGSVIMESTKESGDGVQIYGLGLTALLQKPIGRLTPYIGLGASVRHTSSDDMVLGTDTDFPLHAQAGIRFWPRAPGRGVV